MKATSYIVGCICTFVVCASNADMNDDRCTFIEYPDAVSTQFGLETMDDSLTMFDLQTPSEGRKVDERQLSNLAKKMQLIQETQRALFYAVTTDQDRYSRALTNITELVRDNGIQKGLATEYNLMRLYLYTYDLDLPAVSSEVLLLVLDAANHLENKDDMMNTLIGLTQALFELSQGNSTKANDLVRSISPESGDIDDLFIRAYLTYQLARSSRDERDIQTAIVSLEAVVLDKREAFLDCNQTLYGMAGYFLADAYLLMGKRLERSKEYNPDRIGKQLFKAVRQIEASRSQLDVVRVPGLWANAYDKSAEIYGEIMAYSNEVSAKRFDALRNRSLIIANTY